MSSDKRDVASLLAEAKALARKYRNITGRPLGITGEVAEFAAAEILGLELAEARQSGYDAIRRVGERRVRVQIKGRCIPADANPGQRMGSIQLDKEWDTVLLVILDENMEVVSMHEAERTQVKKALMAPGSKARNERGALGVRKFVSIAREVWTRTSK